MYKQLYGVLDCFFLIVGYNTMVAKRGCAHQPRWLLLYLGPNILQSTFVRTPLQIGC